MPNTIVLKGRLGKRYEEGRAAATIKPGMLIATDANNELIPHGTAGAAGEVLVAIEDGLIGKTIDDNYADNDLVRYVTPQNGDELYMILVDGQDADENEFLTSNGDGKLKVAVVGTDALLFKCREAVAASGADARIKVRRV